MGSSGGGKYSSGLSNTIGVVPSVGVSLLEDPTWNVVTNIMQHISTNRCHGIVPIKHLWCGEVYPFGLSGPTIPSSLTKAYSTESIVQFPPYC